MNERLIDADALGIGYANPYGERGANMYLDDKDYNFKGNYDNYWNCEKCQTSCIEQVRFSKTFKEIWHSENDGVKDYTIRR